MELRFIFKYKFHSLLQRNTDFSLDNFVSSLITALWIGKCTHYSLNTLTSEHKTRWTSTLFAEVEHSSNGHHARPHNNGEGGKTHGGGILEGCTPSPLTCNPPGYFLFDESNNMTDNDLHELSELFGFLLDNSHGDTVR